MTERHPQQPDVNPALVASDPLLEQIADMAAYMDLHLSRHIYEQLTTEQKELWADLVDSSSALLAARDSSMSPARRQARWWRPTDRRPCGEEEFAHGLKRRCRYCGAVVQWDADILRWWVYFQYGNPPEGTFQCKGTPNYHWVTPDGEGEPDPFLYEDEGGTRVPGEKQEVHWVSAAADVARHALLDVTPGTEHWWRRDRDFAALYEWAKQSARPLRRQSGERAGEINALRSYPSPDQAAEQLNKLRMGTNGQG